MLCYFSTIFLFNLVLSQSNYLPINDFVCLDPEDGLNALETCGQCLSAFYGCPAQKIKINNLMANSLGLDTVRLYFSVNVATFVYLNIINSTSWNSTNYVAELPGIYVNVNGFYDFTLDSPIPVKVNEEYILALSVPSFSGSCPVMLQVVDTSNPALVERGGTCPGGGCLNFDYSVTVFCALTTNAPTNTPTTERPTTVAPTNVPATTAPSFAPTRIPTTEPTTESPTTHAPTTAPSTETPTNVPTHAPSIVPTTQAPTEMPTKAPTETPTTEFPTTVPTKSPTTIPTTEVPSTEFPTVTNFPTTLAPTNTPTTSAPTSLCNCISAAPPSSRRFNLILIFSLLSFLMHHFH